MEDDEDGYTLSRIFKSRLPNASTIADDSKHSSTAKRRQSKTCNALEENHAAKGMKSSPLRILAKGDIVWAKDSSFTWRPGQVNCFKGIRILISLFGRHKTRWFNLSDVLRFEESYSRFVGARLSYEVGLALDELARNVAIGLKCCCRIPAEDEDGSSVAKRGFDPQEMFQFLRDKAVLPQVVEGEIATVVRISGAFNAFRYGLVVCNTSDVDEGFCAEGVLSFVLDLAVNGCVDDKIVTQLLAFRKFTSVKPAWFYQLDWDFEVGCLERHKIEVDLELPDCTSEDELYHGRTRDPEDDDSIKPQGECDLVDVKHKEVMKMCYFNTVDFGIFDTVDKYEYLIYDQSQMDVDGGQPADRVICTNTSEGRIMHSWTEGVSIMSEIDSNETATNVSCASMDSKLVSSPDNEPNHIFQAGEEATFNGSIVPNLEKTTGEGNAGMPAQSDKSNSVVDKSSAENLSLRTVPLYRGQFHSLPVNKCAIFSPIKNVPFKTKSYPEVCFNTSNADRRIPLIPEIAPFAETALQISTNKRKLCGLSTVEYLKSPQASLTSFETIAPSRTLMSDSKSSIKFHFRNQNIFLEPLHVHNLNRHRHVSKPYSRNQHQSHHHHYESNCNAFYSSPLKRDVLHSTNNRLKSSDGGNRRNLSVLLNMKFPKDFTLPSKEQLEKKFSVFGPLDRTGTKVFFYTGVGQVVFLHQAVANVAYKYLTKKRLFGQANVRFWFYKYENCSKGSRLSGAVHPSLNPKPCLKKSCMPGLIDTSKNCRVRFTM